jgi:hypothetical protein
MDTANDLSWTNGTVSTFWTIGIALRSRYGPFLLHSRCMRDKVSNVQSLSCMRQKPYAAGGFNQLSNSGSF